VAHTPWPSTAVVGRRRARRHRADRGKGRCPQEGNIERGPVVVAQDYELLVVRAPRTHPHVSRHCPPASLISSPSWRFSSAPSHRDDGGQAGSRGFRVRSRSGTTVSSAASIACPSYPRRRVPSEHGLHHLVGNVYPQFRAGAQLHDFTVDLDRHLLEVGELVLAKTGPRPRTAALTSAASRARSRACPACPVPCNITVRPGCRRASSSLSSAASPEAFPVLLGLKIRTTRSKGCIRSPYGHRGDHLPTFRQARQPENWDCAAGPLRQRLRRIRFDRWTLSSSPLIRLCALSKVAIHHRDAGLNCRLCADVAMTDGVAVDVSRGEAARPMAVDRPDALAIETDVPDPRGRPCESDVYVELWLHHVELDSVVHGRETRATEGRERQVVKPTPSRSGRTRQLTRRLHLSRAH